MPRFVWTRILSTPPAQRLTISQQVHLPMLPQEQATSSSLTRVDGGAAWTLDILLMMNCSEAAQAHDTGDDMTLNERVRFIHD